MKSIGWILACVLATVVIGADAGAQDCATRPTTGVVTGTLSAPQPPCPARGRERPAERNKARKDEPGVIRDGNTTIYYGGSIQTQTTIGGR